MNQHRRTHGDGERDAVDKLKTYSIADSPYSDDWKLDEQSMEYLEFNSTPDLSFLRGLDLGGTADEAKAKARRMYLYMANVEAAIVEEHPSF